MTLEAEKGAQVAVGKQFYTGNKGWDGQGIFRGPCHVHVGQHSEDNGLFMSREGGRSRRRRLRSLIGPPRTLEAARARNSQASATLGHWVKKWRTVSEVALQRRQTGEATRPRGRGGGI
jgi:hypothetical protein